MYLKEVDLATKKEKGWHPGTGSYSYLAAFLKLRLECPVCKAEGDFFVESFGIDEDVENLKKNSQFLAVMKEFGCEKCGVSSRMPNKDRGRALAKLTRAGVAKLKNS